MRFSGLWLLCLVLWVGSPTFITGINVLMWKKGTEGKVWCQWPYKDLNASRRIFCKNDCGEEDILVQTSGSKQTNGRYNIEHEVKNSMDKITVRISNLTLADSGRYRCFWDSAVPNSFLEFKINVMNGENKTMPNLTPILAPVSGGVVLIIAVTALIIC